MQANVNLFGDAVHDSVSTTFDGKVIACTFSTTHLRHAFVTHGVYNGIEWALNDMYRETDTLMAKLTKPVHLKETELCHRALLYAPFPGLQY